MGSELDIRALFGNDAEDINLMLGALNNWNIGEPKSMPDRVMYKIRLAGVEFDLHVVDESSVVLSWVSDVPDDFIIGGTHEKLGDFLDYTTVNLPMDLYPEIEDESVARNTFGKHSIVEIRNSDDRTKRYGLKDTDDLLVTYNELTRDGIENEIKGYVVEGLEDASSSMERAYVFGITFSNPGKHANGIFSLAVPYTPGAEKAFNKGLLMWVFSVHDGMEDPSREMVSYLEKFGEDALAAELSRIISERFPQP